MAPGACAPGRKPWRRPAPPLLSVAVRFDDRATGIPVGLTTLALKPHYFRVVIQAGDPLPPTPDLAD